MKFLSISIPAFFLCLLSLGSFAQSCGSGGGAEICLSSVGSNNNIQLKWTVSGNIDAIQIYRDTDADPTGRSRIAILTSSARSYTDSAAAKGTQYWYWVKFRAGGNFYSSGAAVAQVTTTYPSYNTTPIATDATGMSSNAIQLASKIKLGMNIGNTMESTGCTPASETCWGNPVISAAYMKLIKDSGFDAVRLPVSWNQYANQTTGEIDGAWLNRVKQVVQYAVDNGLYIIVNIHWDGGWLDGHIDAVSQQSIINKQKAFWEQIATQLRGFDEHVIFASANEPPVKTAEQMSILLSYHQAFVDAVRSTGGKNAYRVLVVQGPSTDIETTNNLWGLMPSDTAVGRQMVEVHFYGPYNFALMQKDETWGNQAYYWGAAYHSTTDLAHNATWGEESWIDQEFNLMKAKFVDIGIPVVMGEYGAIRRDGLTGDALNLHLASRAYFYKYVTSHALSSGILPFMWEQGYSPFPLFDRNTPAVSDQQTLSALLIGAGKK